MDTTPPRNRSFPPWDDEVDLSSVLQGEVEDFFLQYANIIPGMLEEHIKLIAQKGWKLIPYPCFQQYFFLAFDLSRSPVYSIILDRDHAGGIFLDLGCGLGQDIRRLIQDGAPAENLIGMDNRPEFFDLGMELFHDNLRLKCRFVEQDFFADTPESNAIAGTVAVINSGYFMHLWNWGDPAWNREADDPVSCARRRSNSHRGTFRKSISGCFGCSS